MTAALGGECGAIEPDSAEIHPIEKTIRDFHLGRLAIDRHAVDFRHGLAEVVHHLRDVDVRLRREEHVLRCNQDRRRRVRLGNQFAQHIVAGIGRIRPLQPFGPSLRQRIRQIEIVVDIDSTQHLSVLGNRHRGHDGAVRQCYGTVTPAQPTREASRYPYTQKQQQPAHCSEERLTASARS